jgi:hypothetical protein
MGYGDSRPLSGEQKGKLGSAYIQKSLVPFKPSVNAKQLRTIENGQISAAKRTNWGF